MWGMESLSQVSLGSLLLECIFSFAFLCWKATNSMLNSSSCQIIGLHFHVGTPRVIRSLVVWIYVEATDCRTVVFFINPKRMWLLIHDSFMINIPPHLMLAIFPVLPFPLAQSIEEANLSYKIGQVFRKSSHKYRIQKRHATSHVRLNFDKHDWSLSNIICPWCSSCPSL